MSRTDKEMELENFSVHEIVRELRKMLIHEKKKEHYGAIITHWWGDTKPVKIDAGGIRTLIDYYNKQAAAERREEWKNGRK